MECDPERLAVALSLRPALFRYANRLTEFHPDAEDLVQETYLRCLPRLDSLSDADAVPGFMKRTLRNYWHDHCRHATFLAMLPLLEEHEGDPEWQASELPRPPVEFNSVEDAVIQWETQARVQHIFFRMPSHYQYLLLLVARGEYYRHAAKRLGVTRQVLKFRAHRAKAAFRREWAA